MEPNYTVQLTPTLSREDLVSQFNEAIRTSGKSDVLIVGGHFPFVATSSGVLVPSYWRDFTPHTFDIACTLANDATAMGKNASIALIVDDHHYIEPNTPQTYKKTAKRELYRAASGENPQIPEPLETILRDNGLDHRILLAQDQQKHGRRNSRLISESIVLADAKSSITNACGAFYQQFLNTYANKETTFVASMIPSPCFGNICTQVVHSLHDFHSMHAYFLFDRDLEKDVLMRGVYERGDVLVQTTPTRSAERAL